MEALPENCLIHTKNDKNNITTNLNNILAKLFTTYGNIADVEIEQKETDLLAKPFNIN